MYISIVELCEAYLFATKDHFQIYSVSFKKN